MGGCASKPKGLKADIDVAPPPAPAKEEESHTVSEAKIDGETKEIVGEVKKIDEGKEANADEGEEKVVKVEVEEDIELDEHGNKRRSLSHLFKENDGNKPTEDGKPQNETVVSEPAKEVESKSENATVESNTNIPETEKIENAAKENSVPIVVAPETVLTEKPIEMAPSVDTVNLEKSEEKKTEDEEKGVVATSETVKTEKPIEVAPTKEALKLEKSEDIKTKEEKEVVVPKTEKPIEVAPPVKNEKLEVSEEKKTKEEGKGVVIEDAKVTEKVPDVNIRKEEPILPVPSAKEVAGEAPEAK